MPELVYRVKTKTGRRNFKLYIVPESFSGPDPIFFYGINTRMEASKGRF
jgi:hypothetical protein